MQDGKIVDLYWARSERAVTETENKYGKYLHRVAANLLGDLSDAEECVNDTYMGAWSSMPTHRPARLAPYLAKLTRWLALGKLREGNALKRGGGELTLALDELAETLDSGFDTQRALEYKELARAVKRLLSELPQGERDMFLARYWYAASIKELAESFDCSEGRVKTTLHRTRKKLAAALEKEGLC